MSPQEQQYYGVLNSPDLKIPKSEKVADRFEKQLIDKALQFFDYI